MRTNEKAIESHVSPRLLVDQTALAEQKGWEEDRREIAFWIEHNCKKEKAGYLVKFETVKQMSQGRMPTVFSA
jgi:hypothetical protein